MLPSISYGNDPICYTDSLIFSRPFFNDIIPNSKSEDLPFPFHFPYPFIQYENDDAFLHQHLDLLPQQQEPCKDDKLSNTISEADVNTVLDTNKGNVPIPIKRSSKRDRHSKINTAQGPRDRRMRLSLEVAREFFGLQDMLGFDKASKTIEWLLTQAKTEIKELAKGIRRMNYTSSASAKTASSTSECEVVSGSYEQQGCITNSKEKLLKSTNKVKRVRRLQKTSFHRLLVKESREKARARARERTREKLWSRRFDKSKLCDEAKNGDLNRLCSFETGEESCTQSHNMNPLLEVMAEVEKPSSHEQEEVLGDSEAIIDDSWVILGKWSPSSMFLHSNVNPQEHQFTDYQFFGKC